METILTAAQTAVETILKAPAVLTLVFALNVIGWLLKKIPALNSKFIPHILIALSAIIGPFLLPTIPAGAVSFKLSNPEFADFLRRECLSVSMGFMAWGFHGLILSKLKEYIPGFSTGDTDQMGKPPSPPQ